MSSSDIPDDLCETMAVHWLTEDLQVQHNHRRFDEWKSRSEDLFRRYLKLKKIMERPLGEGWQDEMCEYTTDEAIDLVERKIIAAEEVLGLTP